MKKLMIMSLMMGVAGALAACGGSDGGKTVIITPGGPADANAKFGAKFAADFKADANSDPASVSASDIVPVDPTAKPSALK
jgi:hypothetical protein